MRFIMPFLSTTESTGTTGGDGGNQLITLVITIGLFALMFYFLLYRPQKKQEKAVAAMRSGLKVGDEISTTGGILGKILQIKDDFIIIETGADKTKMKIAKWAIRAVEVSADSDGDDDEE